MTAKLVLLIGGLLFWHFGKRNPIEKEIPTFAIVLGAILSIFALVVGGCAIYFYIESENFKSGLDVYDQMFGYNPYKSTYNSLFLLASIFIVLSIYFFSFKKSTGGAGTKTRKFFGYLYLLVILIPSIYTLIDTNKARTIEEYLITITIIAVMAVPAYFLCKSYSYEKIANQKNNTSQQNSITQTNQSTIHDASTPISNTHETNYTK